MTRRWSLIEPIFVCAVSFLLSEIISLLEFAAIRSHLGLGYDELSDKFCYGYLTAFVIIAVAEWKKVCLPVLRVCAIGICLGYLLFFGITFDATFTKGYTFYGICLLQSTFMNAFILLMTSLALKRFTIRENVWMKEYIGLAALFGFVGRDLSIELDYYTGKWTKLAIILCSAVVAVVISTDVPAQIENETVSKSQQSLTAPSKSFFDPKFLISMLSCLVSVPLALKLKNFSFTEEYENKYPLPSFLSYAPYILCFSAALSTFLIYRKCDKVFGPYVMLIATQSLLTLTFLAVAINWTRYGLLGIIMANFLNLFKTMGFALIFILPVRITLDFASSMNIVRFYAVQNLISDYAAVDLFEIIFYRLFSDFRTEPKSVLLISAGSAGVILIVSLALAFLTRSESAAKTKKFDSV